MSGLAASTAIITGGASGIGRALGAELHQLGARVVLADIDGEAAERTATELGGSGPGDRIVARRLDVTDAAAVRALTEEIAARDGHLDLLFNNAGISIGGPTDELTVAHWDRIIDVNLRGVVNGVAAAYPLMIEQGHGHIVNTASGAGLVAPPFVAAYAATKHAVVGLSTALRPEAALHGVRVSVLCPGSIETPILDRAPPADLPPGRSRAVTPREYLAVVHQKPVAAQDFARGALRGVERNRGIIVVPASAKSLWYLHRLSPALTLRITGRLARTVDKALVRPGS